MATIDTPGADSRDLFFRLIEDNPFGVYLVDSSFCLAVVSRGCEKVFENVRPLIGRNFDEVLRIVWQEPFATEALDRFHHTLETGEPFGSPSTVEQRGDIDAVEAYDWRLERVTLPDGDFGVVCYFYDLSERQRFESELQASEAALRASEERYRRIFEQSSDLIITADLNQVITDCNPSAAEAVGLTRSEAIGRKISDFVSPEDFGRTTQMLAQKLEHGGTTRYEVSVRNSEGIWLLWEINSGLTFDDFSKPVGLHVVGRDVTERKRWEQHQRLLVGELNHRVKNTLAIVQSLAHQTFRGSSVPKEIVSAFEGRLRALAQAHNLLTRENWDSADLRTLVEAALKVHAPTMDRFDLDGPPVRLDPQSAVTITIAVHELATNAAKYGALSAPGGRVRVCWAAANDRFRLTWQETGGPKVKPPSERGFGSRMIEQALPRELGGTVTLDYAPGGVVCTIDAPLPVAAAPEAVN